MEKLESLAEFLGTDTDDISESSYDDCIFEVGSQEYMVCTEDEAEVKWEESLDSYLEECIYPELPDNMQNYFDDEAWKRDARFDGRGHSLSGYDGNEEEINGFFIYRMN